MRRGEALALLGIGEAEAADPGALRAAYRARMLRSHPDRNPSPDAGELTGRLAVAYRLLLAAPSPPTTREAPGRAEPGAGPPGRGAARRATRADTVVEARVAGADTVEVRGSRDDVLITVLEAAHRLGEVGYLDPSVGLLEVVVEFEDAPTTSLVMSLQGRASGWVEVFCTVEPLSGGESPPLAAVTRLLAATLSEVGRRGG